MLHATYFVKYSKNYNIDTEVKIKKRFYSSIDYDEPDFHKFCMPPAQSHIRW